MITLTEQLTREELEALSASTRQDIMKLLAQRHYTQTELSKRLGKHVTTIAEHTNMLQKRGLIERAPDGHKWVYYKLSRKGEKIFQPRFYSWTILLGLSLVVIILGGFFTGMSGSSAVQYAKNAPLAENVGDTFITGSQPAASDAQNASTNAEAATGADTAVGYIAILLGVIGIALAASRIVSARKQRLQSV